MAGHLNDVDPAGGQFQKEQHVDVDAPVVTDSSGTELR
jgi:hypothetical protein